MTGVLAVLAVLLTAALAISTSRVRALRRQLEAADAAAHTDSLTGLANRAGLHRALRHLATREPRTPVCLILFDLDSFKPVNDRYGHAVGDQVLQEVARRLAATVGDAGYTARLGGDEFVAVLPANLAATDPAKYAERRARKLRAEVAQPIIVDSVCLTVRTSAGAAVLPADQAEMLLSAADNAMYRAKDTALGVCLYGPEGDPSGRRHHHVPHPRALPRHAATDGDPVSPGPALAHTSLP